MIITCYAVKSLELHLFFSRIMKEHAFFCVLDLHRRLRPFLRKPSFSCRNSKNFYVMLSN